MKQNKEKELEALIRLAEDNIIHNDLVIENGFDQNNEISCVINGDDIKISRYFENNRSISNEIFINSTLVIGIIGVDNATIEILKNNPLIINNERYYCMLTYGGDDTEKQGYLLYVKQSFQQEIYLCDFISNFVLFSNEEKEELIGLIRQTKDIKMSKYDFQKFGRISSIFSYCESNDLRQLKKAEHLRYLSDFIIKPTQNYTGTHDFTHFDTEKFYWLAIKGYANEWRDLLKEAMRDTLKEAVEKVLEKYNVGVN